MALDATIQEYPTTDKTFAHRDTCVVLTKTAQQQLLSAFADSFPRETAGPLFGEYAASKSGGMLDIATLREAPAAIMQSGLFSCTTDAALMQRLCDERWPQTYYLGSWHTHPGADPIPSDTDIATAIERACDPAEKCPQHVMLILGGTPRTPRWSVHVVHADGSVVRFLES